MSLRRQLSLFILTSLDGKIARSNGAIDWIWTEPVSGTNSDCGFAKFMSSVKYVVTGRKTFDVSAALEELPFPGKHKYVFTRANPLPTLSNAETTFINDDPVKFVQELKSTKVEREGEGEKIWLLGGAEIFRQLHDADLIDEIILTLQPIILGSGINLYEELKLESRWKLESTESWKEGLVQLTFSRDRSK